MTGKESIHNSLNIKRKNYYYILIVFFILWCFFEFYLAAKAFSLDYDEGVYLQTALQHARGQSLYRELFLSQPPLLVESLTVLIKLFSNNVFIARTFIITFGFLAIITTFLIARELFNKDVAFLACILSGINFYLFYTSSVVQSDMPSLALALFVIYSVLKYNRTMKIKWIMISAILFALSNAFKLLELFFVLPISYLLIVSLFDEKHIIYDKNKFINILKNHIIYTITFLVVITAILLNYHIPSFKSQVIGMGSEGVFHISKRAKMIADTYIGWHPGLFIFTITGLFNIYFIDKKKFYFFITWIISQLTFYILMSTWLQQHHFIVLFPVLSIVSSAGIERFIENYKRNEWKLFKNLKNKKRILYLTIGAFIFLMAIPNLSWNVWLLYKRTNSTQFIEEKELMKIITLYTKPDDLLISDIQMATFRAGRLTYPELVDTSNKRISTGSLKENTLMNLQDDPKLVIFWTGRLKRFQNFYRFIFENYRIIYKKNGREIFIKE